MHRSGSVGMFGGIFISLLVKPTDRLLIRSESEYSEDSVLCVLRIGKLSKIEQLK